MTPSTTTETPVIAPAHWLLRVRFHDIAHSPLYIEIAEANPARSLGDCLSPALEAIHSSLADLQIIQDGQEIAPTTPLAHLAATPFFSDAEKWAVIEITLKPSRPTIELLPVCGDLGPPSPDDYSSRFASTAAVPDEEITGDIEQLFIAKARRHTFVHKGTILAAVTRTVYDRHSLFLEPERVQRIIEDIARSLGLTTTACHVNLKNFSVL